MKSTKHQYRDLGTDQMEEHLANYLIDSWSYSKVGSFARNEKNFEKEEIYGEKSRQSAASVGGQAYHSGIAGYFLSLREGTEIDIVDAESLAFMHIEQVGADKWKIQKTTPSIEECQKKANQTAVAALKNFFTEISIYTDEIAEILDVEVRLEEFVTVNGVDIPLPCRGVIDLVIKTKSGKTVIIDHKCKARFTDDKEVSFNFGKQAVTYTVLYETTTNHKVDEVWFVENKHSKNRDSSPQLQCHKIEMNPDTRRLYEALLYEPLRRMIEAVSNPDYVYLINESDNFIDQAELYDFWTKTMIAEVADFRVPANKQELIEKRLEKIRDASIATINPKVISNFKAKASAFITYDLSNKDMSNQDKIQHRLKSFGIPAQIDQVFEGYSSDTYLLEVAAGTPFSRVYNHRLDIANALGVESVRMDQNLFVYEGKSYFVVEAPKKREENLNFDASFQVDQKIPVGVNNFRETVYWDLANPSTPHALVCGATGSGKSVFLQSTIEYAPLCGVEKFVIFDPKYEFLDYKDRPGFQVYNDIEECEIMLEDLVKDMNNRIRSGQSQLTMVIFDEFADAVQTARKPKQLAPGEKTLEENLKLLLQKGRSSGFRIIAATQRASTKVITGDAKVNFPVQICFRVPKEIDSKVVLDEPGAESLAGQGDGLFRSPDYQNLQRFQAFYVG